MDCEHLWFSNQPNDFAQTNLNLDHSEDDAMVQTLAHLADKRLYKLVKWCKSLPLFKNILVRFYTMVVRHLAENRQLRFHSFVSFTYVAMRSTEVQLEYYFAVSERFCGKLQQGSTFNLLFNNFQIDDQIALLINAWCELLVFSCCYRSVNHPGTIRVSNDKSLTMESARQYGVEKCIEKMLNFTDQLRRLKVDYYEYVSMKVIVLLTSGT